MDERIVEGNINTVQAENGWVRIGGDLRNASGSFFLSSNGVTTSGMILLKREKLAYELEEQRDGKLWLLEKSLSDVVCDPLPPEPESLVQAAPAGPREAVPLLESRPGVQSVLYLDFDGETVTDPAWNSGNTIVAAPSTATNATILQVFDRVKEDWYPFNINVTTDVTKYTAAPVGYRMRCIITPTNTAAPGAGGVAYLRSFRQAGSGFSATIPCWVFNQSLVGITEAVSHELGHTMGLSHDGRITPSEGYYQGHGSGATGWAPIMGVGYYKLLIQWSKGEYTSANNQEDDLAIITAANNHFGYMPDDAGNTRASTTALSGNPTTGAINQVGLIERTGDIDYYTFFTNGGAVTINANDPSSSPNLDVVLELQDVTGGSIQTDNPIAALNASVSATLAQGQYFVKVSPTGAPTPPASGYTNYASLGQYVLTGTVQGLTQNPIVTSTATASGQVGVSFSYQIKATGNPASYGVTGTLPAGLLFDSDSGFIIGFPTEPGTFPVVVSATNASGTGTRDVTITIADAALTLAEAVDFPSLDFTTTPAAPWVGQKTVFYQPPGPPLTDGDAAQAAAIGNDEETSFSTDVTGPVTLDFRWKVASEQDGDFLVLDIDGIEVESISGAVDWTAVSVPLDPGPHTVTWIYRKNSSISEDPDSAWVDDVKFNSTNAPVVDSAPNAAGTVGESFSYQITATNTPWSYALASGTLPLGLTLDTKTGLISGVPAVAGSPTVDVTATNNIGASTPFPLAISIAASSISIAAALDDATPGAYATASTPPTAAAWFPETVDTHDGVDAMQSGPIGPNEQTSITKTVSGINTVNFWWRVEAKPAGNLVQLFVDGTPAASLSGVTAWVNESVFVGPGTHALEWRFSRDASGSLGADAAWLDQVVLTTDLLPDLSSNLSANGDEGVAFNYQIVATNSPTSFSATGLPEGLSVDLSGAITGIPTESGTFFVTLGASNLAGTGTKEVIFTIAAAPVTLSQAVEAAVPPQLLWSTDAATPWAPTAFSFNGTSSGRSGALAGGGKSSIETHASGPVTVSFRWTVDSEVNRDFLRFYIDGVFQAQISGPMSPASGPANWELRSYTLGAGDHTLRWTYSKDLSTSVGRDAGWLDNVTLVAGSALPAITSPLTATAYLGRPFAYQMTATNSPTSFSASPLPADLIVNPTTGAITGTPQAIGTTPVSLSATNGNGAGPIANLVLNVVTEPPGADNFGSATSLDGAAIRVEGTNAFATAESGEPAHAGRAAHASVWYSWTAPLTGKVEVSTAGSNVDTLLSVYQGAALNALTVIAENDDDGKVVSSAVKLTAVAGTTYYIAVDTLNGAAGKIVLNIMYSATGLYSGLLVDQNVTAAPGLASIKLTPALGFSGFIQFGRDKTPMKGSFIGEDFTADIPRKKGATPLNVTLHLDLAPGAEEITGRVIADGVTFNLFAKLALNKSDIPATLPGPFTFIIEPDDTMTAGLPQGTGYGVATVGKTGQAKVIGMLGDGSKFSNSALVATDHSWVLYLTPDKNGGVCAGEVLIEAGALFPPLSATLAWTRAADPKAKIFAAGFGPTTATLKGYRYAKPGKGQTMLLTTTPASLDFAFTLGDLAPAPTPFTGVLDTANKLSGAPAGFKASFKSATGLFGGTLLDSAGGKRAFGGAILQGPSQGAGLFFGNANTGRVTLTPTP